MNLQTEFIQLSLTRSEALQTLRALCAQTVMEEEVRMQQGLETPPLAAQAVRLMRLLGISDENVEEALDDAGDDLWGYSWYVFTSEWAWYRAQQDALRALRISGKATDVKSPDCHRRAELLYRKNFEKYVREIDMNASLPEQQSVLKSDKRKSGPHLRPGS